MENKKNPLVMSHLQEKVELLYISKNISAPSGMGAVLSSSVKFFLIKTEDLLSIVIGAVYPENLSS